MSIEEKRISSLSEYYSIINDLRLSYDLLWFRGHSKESFVLQPSIYRKPFDSSYEPKFMNLFKSKSIKFFPNQMGYFEWLFIMQHYATPTRLLDWSESALVAVAFATQYQESIEENAVVWCLNPIELNKQTKLFYKDEDVHIVNICEETEIANLYGTTGRPSVADPLAILGSYNNERILAQKGSFTLFPNKSAFSLEDLSYADKCLTKIIIEKDAINTIANELYFAGCNELSLFPEPTSVSKEIVRLAKAGKV